LKVLIPVALAALGFLAAAARRAHAKVVVMQSSDTQPGHDIRTLIEREAVAQGVPANVALLFAELESGFNPRAYGDRDWATQRPQKWRELRERMPLNPAIDDPTVWGSYGLFGLLAAYHVQPHEHPHVLWDPTVNARRGVTTLKRMLARAAGDVRAARLLYVGCGLDGSLCSPEHVAQVDSRLRTVAQRWLAQ
jgi:hypothetical protein